MTKHVPVLLPEVMECLAVESADTVLDCTLGSGGYARAVTASMGPEGAFIGIDADKVAVETARKAIEDFDGKACLKVGNFRSITSILSDCGVNKLDAAVFDLGFRSEQLEMGRGFSFQELEAPLEMTFKHSSELENEDVTAHDIVNHWDGETIENILDGYGNESHSEAIARAIVAARREPIDTVGDLVEIIESAVPVGYKKARLHFATRTFQALRMAVNDEVNALKEGLAAAFVALREGGRLAVVSFHSVEDRIVKKYLRYLSEKNLAEEITKGPVTPKPEETSFNPRSRSAKLRAVKKCSTA